MFSLDIDVLDNHCLRAHFHNTSWLQQDKSQQTDVDQHFPITSLNWVVGPVTRAVLGLSVGSNRVELCWITISDDSQDTFEADGS